MSRFWPILVLFQLFMGPPGFLPPFGVIVFNNHRSHLEGSHYICNDDKCIVLAVVIPMQSFKSGAIYKLPILSDHIAMCLRLKFQRHFCILLLWYCTQQMILVVRIVISLGIELKYLLIVGATCLLIFFWIIYQFFIFIIKLTFSFDLCEEN